MLLPRFLPSLRIFVPGLAALWLLAGCTPGLRTEDGAVDLPAEWREKGAAAQAPLAADDLVQWWKRFRDPILDHLVAQALVNSQDTRTALSRVREYRARRGTERAGLFPSLDGGLSGRYDESRDNDLDTSSNSENFGASLDLSWQVDLFGRQLQSVRATGADLAREVENYYGAQVILAGDVADAYFRLREAEEQLAVNERTLETRGETTQLTQWREQAGEGNGLDSAQALSTLEQARANIPVFRQTIAQTRNEIARLCGFAPGALDDLLLRPRGLPGVPARLAIGIPAETLRQRPDVRAAERSVQAAAFRRKAAQLERLPTLNLTGSIGTEALSAGDMFSPQRNLANIAGGLTSPIFNAGRIGQNIRIQDELTRQALIEYERTVLTALSEVENALIAINRTAERLAILQRATTAAREAERLARQQFTAGEADLLNVLEAQRTLLSLEEQLVSTRADQLSAHAQLYEALGGGWSR